MGLAPIAVAMSAEHARAAASMSQVLCAGHARVVVSTSLGTRGSSKVTDTYMCGMCGTFSVESLWPETHRVDCCAPSVARAWWWGVCGMRDGAQIE
jgi:hypothetical protein